MFNQWGLCHCVAAIDCLVYLCESPSDSLRWQMDKAGQTLNRLMSHDRSPMQIYWLSRRTAWSPGPSDVGLRREGATTWHIHSQAPGETRYDFTDNCLCYLGNFEVPVSSSIKRKSSAIDFLLTLTFWFSVIKFYFTCKTCEVINFLKLASQP